MKLIVEVKNCSDCPYRKYVHEQGASEYFCEHPTVGGYGAVLGRDLSVVPDWCPIKERSDEQTNP